MAAKNLHILLTPYGRSPCSSLLTCAAFLSPNLLTPWAETGQAGKDSTSTNPPYVVPNDWEGWVCTALSWHIPWARGLWHYSCCAFISPSALPSTGTFCSQEVEDAVAVRCPWKAPPLWGWNCCHLLPSKLHSPVPVPRNMVMSRELHFFYPQTSSIQYFCSHPSAFPRFVAGLSALLLLHVESSDGKRQ